MFGRHGCMGFNHCIVPTQVKWIPKIFKLVSLGEVGCHSSVDRHPAVLILAFLVSVSTALWTVAYASEIWNSGLFKLLPMCACFTLDVFWYFFSPSSRKWVFLLSWLFVEWPPMVLRSRTRMTEECWISAASIREPWMSFETSLWIWFKLSLGICSSQWVHCWQQISPWELPAKYTLLAMAYCIHIRMLPEVVALQAFLTRTSH